MDLEPLPTVLYRRARFTTRLPVAYRYSRAHAWLAEEPGGLWRIGLTKFAARMLGEMVDHGFEVEAAAAVHPGQILGWLEGFKAISDLFCVAEGRFAGGNPLLKTQIEVINHDPYGAGWLYRVDGTPDAQSLDVDGYQRLLDATIDRMLEREHDAGPPNPAR